MNSLIPTVNLHMKQYLDKISLESDFLDRVLGFVLNPGVPVDCEKLAPPIPGSRYIFTLVTGPFASL